MSQESRKARKLERDERRGIRKKAFEKLITSIQAGANISIDDSMSYQDKFKEVWPLIEPSLEFAAVLRITGEDFDNSVHEIICLGQDIVSNYSDNTRSQLVQKFSAVWNLFECALEVAKLLGNDKQDKLIDKILEIGDWILGE